MHIKSFLRLPSTGSFLSMLVLVDLLTCCIGRSDSSKNPSNSDLQTIQPITCAMNMGHQPPFGLKNDTPPIQITNRCRVNVPTAVSNIRVLSKEEIKERLTSEEVKNLNYYSENLQYRPITEGARTANSPMAWAMPWIKNDLYVRMAISIENGINKLDPSQGRIYRGINHVTPTDLKMYVNAAETGQPMTIGKDCVKWCSASRTPGVAMHFANNCPSPLSYMALLVINQKSARSIENISSYRGQTEFLIPASIKFTVKGVWPVVASQQMLVIYLDEI